MIHNSTVFIVKCAKAENVCCRVIIILNNYVGPRLGGKAGAGVDWDGVEDVIVSVPVLPCCAAELDCHEATSIRFLEERLEGWVHLGGHGFPRVDFLEGEDVGPRKYADGVRDDLVIGIWELADALDLLALLKSIVEHLRRVAGGHLAAEQGVIFI